jgi:alkanesulfonate monooxygenase SsuD/methylene tetrahydromethanopterin reductase-like flavin-dependent oxidoreductase (luciferase family)
VEIGLTLPTMISGVDREATLEWCRRIDQAPFSTLALGERIAYPNQELFVTLAAATVLTERVRLMSTVVVLPMHPAIKVAKQAATIDVLSDGRLTLGLGVGGRDEDYRALEVSFDRRHQRLDDQVALMERVWAGESPFDELAPVGPPPVQAGGPPLYSGALGPKAIARSAAWAEGICGFVLDPLTDDHRGTFDRIEAAWTAAGRAEAPRHVTSFWYALGDDAADRLPAYAHRYLAIFGDEVATMMADLCTASSASRVREAMARLEDAGCDELLLVPTTADPDEVDRIADIVF